MMSHITTENTKLSEKSYWDAILSAAKLPLRVKMKQYSPWLINTFFSETLKTTNYRTLLEAGAGSSAWLPFLASEYGLRVSGLDYSEEGCRICEENLKMQGINYDEVICTDIFKWTGTKKYDIIISLGLIEHFDNPVEILQIFGQHLQKGGTVITVVPNLIGFSGWLTKVFIPDVYKIHKRISKEDLRTMHQNSGFKILRNDYTGFFYPMIIPWNVKDKGLFFRNKTFLRRITLKLLELSNAFLTKILRGLKVRPSSRIFSPFIICVGQYE